MPKPRFSPTAEQQKLVKSLAAYGIPEDKICLLIENPRTGKPIDDKTLRKYFRHELDVGSVLATSKVAENLYRMATGNGREAVTAAIFWMKTRAQWRTVERIETSGPDGGPIVGKIIVEGIDPL